MNGKFVDRELRQNPNWQWAPVVGWAALIFILSSSHFSAANTAWMLRKITALLVPNLSAATLVFINTLTRKSAHFVVYAVFFWLMVRGPMAHRPYLALLLCIIYAALDETHQIFAPGRTPSIYDVALDSTGALFSRFLHVVIVEPV
jgi:VanZ family protein